jgi:hypothetical protein
MPESTGGKAQGITFKRVIVWPDGRKEIEGKTPKQLPAPSPVSVENNDQSNCVEKPSQNSANDDQQNQGLVDTDFRCAKRIDFAHKV